MPTVADILSVKGDKVWSTEPDTTVYQALKMMADKDVGALLVMDKGEIVGIFTERDYARKVILKGKASQATPINAIMSKRVFFVQAHQSMDECMALMTAKHIRHLPVIEGDKLGGLISIGDVVKAIISGQQFEIKQLEHYVEGLLHGR
ncbi:MAG: CBS domain-containing protein [Candidatus Marinimicrobia bacterium]|nr:CBS domain-containing protein [Candidatus Neomarinimicrobiota bacterium]